jgi:predicted RNA binding protein YcfA (HicA-like mRNA interferase family)
VTGNDVANALVNLGWKISDYQNKHIVLIREDHQTSLSVPNNQFVAKGVIKKLIKFAEINIGDQLISNEAIRETLLKQYQTHVDLYKHYIDLTLKVNIFYYAITGAILSFYFTRSHDNNIIRYSLLLLLLMSLFYAIIFI